MTKAILAAALVLSNFLPQAVHTARFFPDFLRGEVELELYAWGVECTTDSFFSMFFLWGELFLLLFLFRLVVRKAKSFGRTLHSA